MFWISNWFTTDIIFLPFYCLQKILNQPNVIKISSYHKYYVMRLHHFKPMKRTVARSKYIPNLQGFYPKFLFTVWSFASV